MFRPGLRRPLLRCLGCVVLLGLGGCTAILDFSEPIEPPSDAGDGGAVSDGQPDAALQICTAFEPNESTALAKLIEAPMDIAAGTCAADDVDIFVFMLTEARDVEITLSFIADSMHDIDLRLLDADGSPIAVSTGDMNTEMIVRSAQAAGTYFIEIVPVTVASAIPYSVNLTTTLP